MIRHTVAFRLKSPAGSPEEKAFLAAAQQLLATLPNVQRFESLRQVSRKNNFSFGFSMEFADEAAYSSYNSHPVHQAFLRERWVPQVAEFMELDYVVLT
jgi:hypothetical protein